MSILTSGAKRPQLPAATRANVKAAVLRGYEQNGLRLDAGETMAVARQLEQIITGNFNYKYADNKALQLFAADRSHDPGAESFTYRQYDYRGGTMDRIVNWAKDFPGVSAVRFETTAGYNSFGASYTYSLQDLRRAAYGDMPLESTLATTVRMVASNTVEQIAAVGWSESQISGSANPIYGMLNTPNVPVLIPRLSVSGATGVASVATSQSPTNVLNFTTATPEQIAAAFDSVAAYVSNQTKGVWSINRAIIPLDMYNFLATKLAFPTYDSIRVIDLVLKSSKYIKSIEPWLYCSGNGKGSDGAGATGTARCLFDGGANTDAARLVLPVEFEQFAPQVQGLAWTIPCHMRTGGAWVPQPLSMAYLDGTGF